MERKVQCQIEYVCKEGECTACRSCIQICPQNCIRYVSNNHETISAAIDREHCITCQMCKKACPQLNQVILNKPQISYAAWSERAECRRTSASGGIAAELYRYFAEKNAYYAGVFIDETFMATYKLLKGIEGIDSFKNSKYVYSDTKNTFKEIRDCLTQRKEVLFIGLPCQVAGLKQFLKVEGVSEHYLFTVDLICHGTTPSKFLMDHISYLERKKKRKAQVVNFRDPEFGSNTYTFTLRGNDEKLIYKKSVHRNDTYQIGYHSGIIYRDNCYKCKYARRERCGDITLADYSGLGTVKPCSYTNEKVSCVLINTSRGGIVVENLIEMRYIHAEIRPIEEEFNNEKQLKGPTPITYSRKLFLSKYERGKQFETAMKVSAKQIICRNEVYYYFHIDKLRRVVSMLLPIWLKEKIRNMISK